MVSRSYITDTHRETMVYIICYVATVSSRHCEVHSVFRGITFFFSLATLGESLASLLPPSASISCP